MDTKDVIKRRIFIYFLLFITAAIVWACIQKINATNEEELSQISAQALPGILKNRGSLPEGY